MNFISLTQEEFDSLRYDDPRGEGYTLKLDTIYEVAHVDYAGSALERWSYTYGVTPDGVGMYWYNTEQEARDEHE